MVEFNEHEDDGDDDDVGKIKETFCGSMNMLYAVFIRNSRFLG